MRKSIQVAGFSHGKNPTPAASVLGNLMMTGAIFGMDPEIGKIPEDREAECRIMFDNVERILAAAGCSFEDVLKMTFYVRPEASRELINEHWVRLFPNEASRPARHVIVSQTLPGSMQMQCDCFALVSERPS